MDQYFMSRCDIGHGIAQASEFLKSVKWNVRIRKQVVGNVRFRFFLLFYMGAVLISTNSEGVSCFSH